MRTAMNRRTVKYLLVFALLGLAAWYTARTMPGQAELQPLDQLLAKEAAAGWRVARSPELAGPYRRSENPQRVGRGAVGTVVYGRPPTTLKLPVRDDAEQMALPLQTADGSVTVVVLER